jgi:hypothetical protein
MMDLKICGRGSGNDEMELDGIKKYFSNICIYMPL